MKKRHELIHRPMKRACPGPLRFAKVDRFTLSTMASNRPLRSQTYFLVAFSLVSVVFITPLLRRTARVILTLFNWRRCHAIVFNVLTDIVWCRSLAHCCCSGGLQFKKERICASVVWRTTPAHWPLTTYLFVYCCGHQTKQLLWLLQLFQGKCERVLRSRCAEICGK